jgi:hypothetical protein
LTFGANWTASETFCGRSVFGKAFRVTTTLALVSRRMALIFSGSRSGLIGLTIPATAPPRRVMAVSIAFGRMKATTSFSPIPRLRNRFAAWVTLA